MGYGGITVNKEASLNIIDSKFLENKEMNEICIDNHGNLTVILAIFQIMWQYVMGCVSSLESDHTTIINSTFEFNNAGRNGGALKINDAYVDIFNCIFVNNTALGNDNYGGAVYTNGKNKYGIFECYGCEYLNNTSPEGGAIYIRSTSGQINYCRFVNNTNTIYHENYEVYEEIMDLNDNWWASNNPNFNDLIVGKIAIKNYTTVKLDISSQSKINTPIAINLNWSSQTPQRNPIFNRLEEL